MNFPLVTIKELGLTISDGNYSSKYPRSDEFVEHGIPFLSAYNLVNGQITLDGTKYISPEHHQRLRKGHLMEGDVLLVTRGSLGRSAYVTRKFSGANINAQLVLLRSNNCRILNRYLYYVTTSSRFQEMVLGFASGTAQPQLPVGPLKLLSIPCPPLVTQRKIAAVLSAYDDLIENNTRRIAILEKMARRSYEEWFVRFRFPGHERVRMVESELGLVPEGWEVATLGQLAEVNARSVRRGAEPTDIRYVDISSVSTGSIDNKEPMLFAEAPGRARRIVRDGDVIWACVRPNRKSYALVLYPEPNLLVSTGFAVLTPIAAPSSFVYQCVTTDDFVSHLVNHAKGAAYPAVSAEDFENAKVLMPANDLVEAFDRIAEPMMRLVAVLQVTNINLRSTRDLLLPKLISGELDVSAIPEPEALAA